jgi:hypothetical protein
MQESYAFTQSVLDSQVSRVVALSTALFQWQRGTGRGGGGGGGGGGVVGMVRAVVVSGGEWCGGA